MVHGPRRWRAGYAVNARHNGLTKRVYKRAVKARRVGIVALVVSQQALALGIRDYMAEQLALVCLTFARHWLGNVLVLNPVFVRTPQTLADFSNAELYAMRITNRNHITRMLAAMQFPPVLRADNRSKIFTPRVSAKRRFCSF